MRLPHITTVSYYDDGVWSGQARCRGGHQIALPDQDFAAWQYEHSGCQLAAAAVPAATTELDAQEVTDLCEGIRDSLDRAIAAAFAAAGGFVVRWLVIAEAVEADGARKLWLPESADLKPWDGLGMIEFAAHAVKGGPGGPEQLSEGIRTALDTGVPGAIGAAGFVVTRWLVVAGAVGDGGERGLWMHSSRELEEWEAVGLLRFARRVKETAHIDFCDEDDPDDDDE